MRLFTNKKGQEITTSKVFYWLVGLALAIMLVFSIWGFGASFFNSLTATPEILKEDLFIARITNTCFALTEQTTPTQTEQHPNIIDLSLVSNEHLHSCFIGESTPAATVTIKPLSTTMPTFSSRRAVLFDDFSQTRTPVDALTGKKPRALQPRYVLAKEVYEEDLCEMRKNAISLAENQGDNLFQNHLLLKPEDFLAIKNSIEQCTYSGSNFGPCSLKLSVSSTSYNPSPYLSDFCYSKEGPCTYNDFLIDYKGSCQTKASYGKTHPAELQVIFYD
ncbi:hypothetical protein K9M74_02480 [Candidatus Woesearchaeota archaeon]|nr:hypothetical protein [Candidatus Woesearchaeota archaeon]